MQHPFHIISIVEGKRLKTVIGRGFHICVVYADKFAAAVGIFPLNAKELLQCFLLAVGKAQERFIRNNPAVNINPFKIIEMVRQIVLAAFLKQKWKVEVIAVKMDKMAVASWQN